MKDDGQGSVEVVLAVIQRFASESTTKSSNSNHFEVFNTSYKTPKYVLVVVRENKQTYIVSVARQTMGKWPPT